MNENDKTEPEIFRKAFGKAVNLLSSRDRSKYEIIKALSEKGFDGAVTDMVIKRLTELGYIDDQRFAGRITQSLLGKGYGRYQIKQRMSAKGIEDNAYENAISLACSYEEEFKSALSAATKKMGSLGSETDIIRIKAKLSRFLVGRGFSYDISRDVVNEIISDYKMDHE